MTAIIKLVRLDDFIADIDSVDLLSGGFSLAADGYAPAVAPIGAKSVHETITLTLKGTSTDDLALMVQEIDAKIKQVQWWIDNPGVERYQVWLRVQMDEESNPRQAQILNIEPANKVNEFTKQETDDHTIIEYTIGIERTPFWEQPYPYPNTTGLNSINASGGKVALSETINGDVPARLAKMTFTMGSTAAISTSAYFGFKSSRFGNPANFVPKWDLTDAYSYGADTSVSGGAVVCTFATVPTLAMRAIISVDQVAPANPADQRGEYAVILIAKMSITGFTGFARVRMGYGSSLSECVYTATFRSRQVINSTDYALYELGNISIPSGNVALSESLSSTTIRLDAEFVNGTGTLTMASLILIPTEAMIKIASPDSSLLITTDPVSIYQKANGVIYAYSIAGGTINTRFFTQPSNWNIPANNDKPSLVYCGYQSVDVTYTYIPRWRTLRGAGLGPAT